MVFSALTKRMLRQPHGAQSPFWFFLAVFAFGLGRNGYAVACAWLLANSDDGPAAVTVFFAIISATELVASPLVGWICDRYDRRLVIICSDGLRCLIFALLALAVFSATEHWVIWLSAVIHAACDRATLTASQAMIPVVKSNLTLQTANSVSFFCMQFGGLAAAMIVAVLLVLPRSDLSFTLISSAFLISALCMIFVDKRAGHQVGAQAVSGITLRFDGRVLRLGTVYVLLYVGGMLVSILGPVFVLVELKGGALDFGSLESYWSAGSIVGALLLVPLGRVVKLQKLLSLVLIVTAISFLATPFLKLPWGLSVFLAIGGLYNLGRVVLEVALQSTVPIGAMGRVKGTFHGIAVFAGLGFYGVIVAFLDAVYPTTIFAAYALILMAMTLVFGRRLVSG